MGTVYIRKSYRPGRCLACLQTLHACIVHIEVSLLLITQGNSHGLFQPWSSMILKIGDIQNCIAYLIALIAVEKLHVLCITKAKKTGGGVRKADQVTGQPTCIFRSGAAWRHWHLKCNC